jgi:hypothetical protein
MEEAMRITEKYLQKLGACPAQVEVFAAEWPKGCEISRKTLRRAIELDLDISWLARKVMKGEDWKVCTEARETAWKAYEEAIETAWKACVEARETATMKALNKLNVQQIEWRMK